MIDIKNDGKNFFLGLQHVLAMYAGSVVVPLIIGGALKLNPNEIALLITADLFTCGIATFLQAYKTKFSGIGLPVVLGCTFTAVAPMIAIGNSHDINTIFGAVIASGIFVCLFATYFSKMVRFFPTLVTGTIVTIIGASLIPVAMDNFAGGVGAKDFGSLDNLTLGLCVFFFIIFINRFFKGYMQAISVLLGIVFGTVLGIIMGKVDLSPVSSASWFNFVKPFYFGMPKFEISSILTMIIVAVVSMVESTGIFLALGDICDKKIGEKDLAKGYRAEGLSIIFAGIFNSFPRTTFSQNVGLVQIAKVKSVVVTIYASGILIFLGLIPKFAALATIIPASVLGGAMLVMFGMVISAGISMLKNVEYKDNQNLLIIACSVAIGIGITVSPSIFNNAPEIVKIIFGNGIVSGSLCAVFLNLLFNHSFKIKKA
ncbi:MAG: Uric acid permease PucK [Alphaproteobacteria bacterium ADurb.Bin438]|nr:MAG: Uric acid permease PucK [Alphaproteobacteria bacterium ADurb.Bin438]